MKSTFTLRLLTPLFLFITSYTVGQTSAWTNFTNPTNIYSAALENNFIWVASSGGIVKLDTNSGVSTFYNEFNSGLPTPNVFSVAVDLASNKWFGTGGGPTGGNVEAVAGGAGLVKFDGITWTTYNTSNSGLAHNTVRALLIDSLGILWAGTYGGLARFNGTSWTTYNTGNSGLPSDSITSLTTDNNGKLWIGTFHGAACFDGNSWLTFKHSNSGLPGDTIRTIAVDQNNVKWFGTSRAGVGKYNDTTWVTYNILNSGIPKNNVTAILPSSDGKIYFGTYGNANTYGGGLTAFDGLTWYSYLDSNSPLPKNNVPVILEDTYGKKWIMSERGQRHGDGTGKVSGFNGTDWRNYNISNSGIISNFCYYITLQGSRLWFGGEKFGLTMFDGSAWTNYNSENSAIIDDDILDLKFDSNGVLWATHDGGKLSRFDGNNFNYVTTPGANFPYCLFIDTTGDKWIGENGTGIFIWDDTTWTNINTSNSGLPNNYIHCITRDQAGNKWIATYGGGVAKFDGTNWTIYNTTNTSLITNNVNYIKIDQSQNKWVATQNGLAKFDGTNWTLYRTVNSGLPSNVVYSVDVDSYGDVWATTSNGFARFNGSAWTTYNFTIPALMVFRHVNFDSLGNVWIATLGRGIIKIPRSSIATDIAGSNYKGDKLLNFPNPFSTETYIELDNVPQDGSVSINIYDVTGKEVNCLYSITDSSNGKIVTLYSSDLNSGIYFFTAGYNSTFKNGKMIIQK
ncbi:MAG: two component regulator propeller domain protein [Bacteroidota bacterium]|jgi:ligand-binding sensor domain-containing protein|nr:two component regulator propeller domain protein [Bacteroidota bacterium]